ncbi:hypothetical protein HRbin39_01678 [bacterium HR39]|nr:hypothetical protein HRbin39_01678 [bacterium HR39]
MHVPEDHPRLRPPGERFGQHAAAERDARDAVVLREALEGTPVRKSGLPVGQQGDVHAVGRTGEQHARHARPVGGQQVAQRCQQGHEFGPGHRTLGQVLDGVAVQTPQPQPHGPAAALAGEPQPPPASGRRAVERLRLLGLDAPTFELFGDAPELEGDIRLLGQMLQPAAAAATEVAADGLAPRRAGQPLERPGPQAAVDRPLDRHPPALAGQGEGDEDPCPVDLGDAVPLVAEPLDGELDGPPARAGAACAPLHGVGAIIR